jgi:hypothetical protein
VPTLSDLVSLLRTDLRDSGADRWPTATLERHIRRAVRELSEVMPQEKKTTLQTTIGSRDVSISGLADLVRVEAVEYPLGDWPPSYVPFSVWQTTLTMHLEGTPGAVEDLSVLWGALHVVDGSGSTVPGYAEDVVLVGAAGYAAVEWSSFATNRANVSGVQAVENYGEFGRERLRQFRAALRRLGRNARVRTSQLYTTGRPRASRQVVSFET